MNTKLEQYDPSIYDRPSVTVDVLLFTIIDRELKILLVRRKEEPFMGSWALPGGFVRINESLDEAAKRELQEETGVKDIYLEQLYTFGNPKRDPRTRVITVSYLALSAEKQWLLESHGDASEAAFFSVKETPRTAFDHESIIKYGLDRLRNKLGYTNISLSLVPESFTLTDLQKVYEIILDETIDKRNFRKKILASGLLLPTGSKTDGTAHRPAMFYRFKNREVIITD